MQFRIVDFCYVVVYVVFFCKLVCFYGFANYNTIQSVKQSYMITKKSNISMAV